MSQSRVTWADMLRSKGERKHGMGKQLIPCSCHSCCQSMPANCSSPATAVTMRTVVMKEVAAASLCKAEVC